MFIAAFTPKHPENIICSLPQNVKYQVLLPGTEIPYSELESHFMPVFRYKHRYVHKNVGLRRLKRSPELHFPNLLYGTESMRKHDKYKFSRADPSGRTVRRGACGRSLAGIKGSNPAGAWMPVSCECFVCCEVQVSARGRSLVQRSPIDCACVCVCVFVIAYDRVKQ